MPRELQYTRSHKAFRSIFSRFAFLFIKLIIAPMNHVIISYAW